jgi:hypothetical protein
MTTFLDIRTLSIVLGLTIATLGISMFYYSRNRRVYPGFITWSRATFLMALSFFLVGFRHILPDVITIILANALIYAALSMFYLGFKSFVEKKLKIYKHIHVRIHS